MLGYECPEFDLAGSLEPAYEVAGDNFDYAVAPEGLTLSITDGMGHGLRAAMITNLVVTALRNARRAGGSITDQAAFANQVVCEQFGTEGAFATSLLLHIDMATGETAAVNAGAPPPWLGRDSVTEAHLRPQFPFGVFDDTIYIEQPLRLSAGDRLVLVSDGVTEAAPTHGDSFGHARFEQLLRQNRDQSPLELVRKVLKAVTAHRNGPLRDDATLLCLDFKGDPSGGPDDRGP